MSEEESEASQSVEETKIVDGKVYVVKHLKQARRNPLGIGKVHVAEGSSIAKQRK